MLERTQEPQRIWDEGDPEMPAEFAELLVRMLSYHVENSTNPHYTESADQAVGSLPPASHRTRRPRDSWSS